MIKEGKSKKEAYGNKNRHYFLFQKKQDGLLSNIAENSGEKICRVCRIKKGRTQI
jgi:hypothetical protein